METAKDNLDAQYILIIVLMLTAIIVLGEAIYSRYQTKKERKRPAIIGLIVEAIDKSREEFQALNTKLEKIQEKIDFTDVKNVPIIALPSKLYIYHLTSSSWKDFEKENPRVFSQIQDYLIKKESYISIDKACLQNITESIKKINIDKEMDLLIKELREKSRTRGTNQEYLHKNLSDDLSKCILTLNNVGNQAPELFNRFKNRWLKLRKEIPIKQQIENLAELLKNLFNYTDISKNIENTRRKIMKKYNIMDGTLKNYIIEKKRLDFSIKSQQDMLKSSFNQFK